MAGAPGTIGTQVPPGPDEIWRQIADLQRQAQQALAFAANAQATSAQLAANVAALAASGTTWAGPVASPTTVSAGTTVAATTSVTAGTSLNGATLVTTSDANIGGNVNAPNGTLISAYARAHSVVTSYVAAYIDGSGNFLSTPSALRMKRDIATKTWTREQRDAVRVVAYRLRAAYILADMRGEDLASVETLAGVIGEDLLAAGLDEFVVLDDHGRVFTVRYELLALVAIDGLQQAEARMDELEARLTVAGF